MNAKHTAGPWTTKAAKYEGDVAVIAVNEKALLAECFEDIRAAGEHAREECAANARLIAAAPELFDVVEALVFARDHYDGRVIVDENSPIIDAARAALAKARGES